MTKLGEYHRADLFLFFCGVSECATACKHALRVYIGTRPDVGWIMRRCLTKVPCQSCKMRFFWRERGSSSLNRCGHDESTSAILAPFIWGPRKLTKYLVWYLLRVLETDIRGANMIAIFIIQAVGCNLKYTINPRLGLPREYDLVPIHWTLSVDDG